MQATSRKRRLYGNISPSRREALRQRTTDAKVTNQSNPKSPFNNGDCSPASQIAGTPTNSENTDNDDQSLDYFSDEIANKDDGITMNSIYTILVPDIISILKREFSKTILMIVPWLAPAKITAQVASPTAKNPPL